MIGYFRIWELRDLPRTRTSWSSLAYSAVKVVAILIMLYCLITPSDILVLVRYSVIMQIMIVLVNVPFIAM